MKTNVTVGIITYKRPKILKKCLKAISKQTVKPKEVILIDSSEKRIIQPITRNLILEKCKTEIIAFLDDDAIPTRYWLENIVKGYSNPEIVGVGGPCINVDESFTIKEKIINNTENRNYFKSSGDIRCDGRKWIPPEKVETQIMLGGNMSFLTNKLREVGGFDENYKGCAFREETDPQVALIKKGYKFLYEPKALVHHVQTSKGGINKEKKATNYYYQCGSNHKYFCDKYFSKLKSRLSWVFWSISPPCLWLTLVLAILRRDKRYFGWIKGLWWK